MGRPVLNAPVLVPASPTTFCAKCFAPGETLPYVFRLSCPVPAPRRQPRICPLLQVDNAALAPPRVPAWISAKGPSASNKEL